MGIYLNPPGESKEAFLERMGERVSGVNWSKLDSNKVPVIWIDNGPFSAAGIAYNKKELEAFLAEPDDRPRKLYLVPVDEVVKVSPLKKEWVER